MPAVTSSGFCKSHADAIRYTPPAEEDLSAIMLSLTGESGLDVHTALEKVFLALAGNRITARRAATFGYLGQLILLSAQEPVEQSRPQSTEKTKPSRSSKGIEEALIQAALGKLREKFPLQPERPPIPPGRNYNIRS